MMAAWCVVVLWIFRFLPLLPVIFGLPDTGKGMLMKLDFSKTACCVYFVVICRKRGML